MHQTRITSPTIRSFLIESARRNVESGTAVENFFDLGINDTASRFSLIRAFAEKAIPNAIGMKKHFAKHAENTDATRVFTQSKFSRCRVRELHGAHRIRSPLHDA